MWGLIWFDGRNDRAAQSPASNLGHRYCSWLDLEQDPEWWWTSYPLSVIDDFLHIFGLNETYHLLLIGHLILEQNRSFTQASLRERGVFIVRPNEREHWVLWNSKDLSPSRFIVLQKRELWFRGQWLYACYVEMEQSLYEWMEQWAVSWKLKSLNINRGRGVFLSKDVVKNIMGMRVTPNPEVTGEPSNKIVSD
jgi:hypothetical protein